jgi:hypothetical protein
MSSELAGSGFVFWPVGNGDSTTVLVDAETYLQVDLHYREDAGQDDDPHMAVVDELKDALPVRDGEPYLAAFALSHPDEDHCKGFAYLLDEVQIGELWLSPRVFREYKEDLSEDAVAFKEEAARRRDATIEAGGDPGPGDRIRLFGYDELLEEEDYEGFPDHLLSIPGTAVTHLDGRDRAGAFRAFVHAPFKDDSAGQRNETSLGLQISLSNEGGVGRALLLGDLSYPTIRKIFDRSDKGDLRWDVLLAPHHCSKSVMYWQDEETGEEERQDDILQDLEEAAGDTGWVVASSEPVPASDSPGDNPPHAKAKRRYSEIVPDDFVCTQEHPNKESPEPVVFEISAEAIVLAATAGEPSRASTAGLEDAVEEARGSDEPPSDETGFGAG